MIDKKAQQAPTMRKWEIYLNSGDHFTMLSEQCQTAEEALAAAREKWSERVEMVVGQEREAE